MKYHNFWEEAPLAPFVVEAGLGVPLPPEPLSQQEVSQGLAPSSANKQSHVNRKVPKRRETGGSSILAKYEKLDDNSLKRGTD